MPRSPLAESEGVPGAGVAGAGGGDGADGDRGDGELRPAPPTRRWWTDGPGGRPSVHVAVLALALAVPLAVALGVLRRPRWLPLSDIALIEMSVRDVGTRHTPLIGVYGRFEGFGEYGSHPGPLLFYLLRPVYTVAGADGWSLILSSYTLALAAGVTCIWIGHRRGGWPFALAVTAVLVLLARAYGAEQIAEAWNPNVAMLWWVVFLLAVWSVLCRDLPLLPVAVFAGSLCVQSHVGYAGLVAGLLVPTAVWLGVTAARSQDDDDGGDGDGHATAAGRRRALRWAAISLGVGLLLWLPPVIDEVVNEPGNLEILVEGFRHPTEERSPFHEVADVWLSHLEPVELVTGDLTSRGSLLPGQVWLAVWLATAVVAWRRRDPALVRLHLVVGAATLLGLISISRILGPLWPYLTLWAWGTTALMVLAAVWTLVARPSLESSPPAAALAVPDPARPAPTIAALGAATLLLATLFTVDASSTEMADATLSRELDVMAGAAAARLDQDPAGCGDDCRYEVTWADPLYIGSHGFGMLVELERRGFDVGGAPREAARLADHRVVAPAEADAVVHVAVTDDLIEAARATPGAEELAYVDPYTPAEHEQHRRFRRRVADALRAEGFDEQAAQADRLDDQRMIPLDSAMSHELGVLVEQANAVYRPAAVFLLPPEAG